MPAAPLVGRRLGPFEVLGLVGRGGMGEVYRARDTRLGREVALKVLAPAVAGDPQLLMRFEREAKLLASLSHPNVLSLHEYGEEDGVAFAVSELLEGETLRDSLGKGGLPLRRAVEIAAAIARGVGAAHAKGIIHRDLKPGNVFLLTDGTVKVLDFGLAREMAPWVQAAAVDSESPTEFLTEKGIVLGTPGYLAPEQVRGQEVDGRADLFAIGCILIEMLGGGRAFRGETPAETMVAVLHDHPPMPPQAAGLPGLEEVIGRCLEKDRTLRFQQASELVTALEGTLGAPSSGKTAALSRGRLGLLALGVALLVLLGAWWNQRADLRQWARTDAVREARGLREKHLALAAFQTLERAAGILPDDSEIKSEWEANTQSVSITSSPDGAAVAIQDYLAPEAPWRELGSTPITDARLPQGYFRWRLRKSGAPEYLAARKTDPGMGFTLESAPEGKVPMAHVPKVDWGDFIAFVGWAGPYVLPAFDIDRFEVTNREYQTFVDQGGYASRKFWTEPFREGGREVVWETAMERFRDHTGRPGPSTWEGGHFPEGHGDDPVSGVSWYEASAFALFAGKSLPTFPQWYEAAPPGVGEYIAPVSNISRQKLAPVGAFKGLGPYGTYDMAGNVREWASNALNADRRFILGGAWTSPTYLYAEPEALPAWDRSPANGLRCVLNTEPLPEGATRPVKMLDRDFTSFKPATEAVFRAYQAMYAYDRSPLEVRDEGVVHETPDWRMEKTTFNAAYGGERLSAYLFLPKRVRPPFQTVVFFPSARVLSLTDSSSLGDISFVDYVVQSGRAVVYPVYQETYERRIRNAMPGSAFGRAISVQRAQDLGRALDYLETRPDIARDKWAYLGVSMGAAEGVVYTTLAQNRLKAAVFLDGGYFLDQMPEGADQADFAPHLKIPVLMVNGRYDASFSLDRSQEPLFRMLGTPAADKRHVVLDTPHDVRQDRPALIREVLAWLDKYLGRVGS